MINVSLIAPTNLIKDYGNQGEFHLALAHLLGPVDEMPNAYEEAIIESGLPIILDNGLFENGESVHVRELMQKAVHLNAEYVFAPDVLFDKRETEHMIGVAYEELQKLKEDFPENKTQLAAVVQGETPGEYLDSYMNMVKDDRVGLIGLSILSIPKCFSSITNTEDITNNRITCLHLLNGLREKKASHMLGAGSSYEDVYFAASNCSWVISHDSSSAIWNGVQGHKIMDNLVIDKGKTKVPVRFDYQEELSENQRDLIDHNIQMVKKARYGKLEQQKG